MKRLVLTIAASTLALVVLVVGIGFVALRTGLGPRVAEAAGLGPWTQGMPAELQGLQNLPPAERFAHFLGATMRYTDADNNAHTVNVTPGTVTSVTSDKLEIKANDGSSKTFNLTSETRIRAMGQPGQGGQTQATPKVDDKVVVVALDNSADAKAVMIGGPNGFGHGFGPHGGPWQRGNR